MLSQATKAFQLIAAFCVIATIALADQPMLPLPALLPCQNLPPPRLPGQWRGTYLMAPFTKGQLVLGDFIFDGVVFRARLYGLRRGALDLIVKGRNTFVIADSKAPSGECFDLGDTGLRAPRPDLLRQEAQCQASASVAGTSLDWWKAPSSDKVSANWFWFKSGDSSPFRLMFTQPSDAFPVLGWFAFSYRVRFAALLRGESSSNSNLCNSSRPHPAGNGRAALIEFIAAMDNSPHRADAEIARLIPEFEAPHPSGPLPSWPEQTSMTALMTSPNYNSAPSPTEILYDWARRSQRTRIFRGGKPTSSEDALLAGGYGHSITRSRKAVLSCAGGLPGTLRPNWPKTGGCSFEAIIKSGSALAPAGAKILVCPMTPPRVVWAWFDLEGRPLVFMETSATADPPADFLTLVDYHSWIVGEPAPPEAFATPAQCSAAGAAQAHIGAPHPSQKTTRVCGACHLDDGNASR